MNTSGIAIREHNPCTNGWKSCSHLERPRPTMSCCRSPPSSTATAWTTPCVVPARRGRPRTRDAALRRLVRAPGAIAAGRPAQLDNARCRRAACQRRRIQRRCWAPPGPPPGPPPTTPGRRQGRRRRRQGCRRRRRLRRLVRRRRRRLRRLVRRRRRRQRQGHPEPRRPPSQAAHLRRNRLPRPFQPPGTRPHDPPLSHRLAREPLE